MGSDVIVIGSGFGGSVAALRLVEKGYTVRVIEAGRRFGSDDFAKSSWNLRRFLWAPHLGMRGIQRINLLRDVMILSGAGVGGGSLVYANTLIEPHEEFFADRQWRDITDWRDELDPWYDQARRMLGAEPANAETPSDRVVAHVAEHFDCVDSLHPTTVGVYRGTRGETAGDPYFGGRGPTRTGCIECGGCMVGCRYEAKNTLDRNYLYLAEQAGAEVTPDSEVVDLEHADGAWSVTTERPGAWLRKRRKVHRADQVIFAAGGLGTTRLLLKLRDRGRLPAMSAALGWVVRTNSEAIVGSVARGTDVDYSEGVAITSALEIDDRTRIEPVRYPKGSNSMGLLGTVLVAGGRGPQFFRFLKRVLVAPGAFLRSFSVRRWSERSLILLVMQSFDNSIRLRLGRGLFGKRLRSGPGHGTPNPRWIPEAHEAARAAAEVMEGDPMASINESVLGIPLTAHIIGGAVIGSSPEQGVIDPYHRMYGQPGLHVIDGSAVPANLGANPSLTITAMAERALSFWPNKGDPEARPEVGESYRRIDPVPPRHPVVPGDAPAALKTPS